MLAYAAFNGTLTRGYTLRSQWLSLTLNGTLYTRGHIAVATTWALGLCCALSGSGGDRSTDTKHCELR